MKVYISSHDRDLAVDAAAAIAAAGHEVGSTWHSGPMTRSANLSEDAKAEIATRNVNEIRGSDALVLVASEDRVPGGKFVELGVAIGIRLPVVVVGRRENILSWHPDVKQVDGLAGLAAALQTASN